MASTIGRLGCLLAGCLLFSLSSVRGTDEPAATTDDASQPADRARTIEELQIVSVLVGDWRGVGQPRRGSRVGAWIEQAGCLWTFKDDATALVLSSESGRQYRQLQFTWNPEHQAAVVTVRSPDDESQELVRHADLSQDDVEVFLDNGDADAALNRMTFRRISDIRVTLLFETRTTTTASWRRVTEVGYTRAGERLAASGAGERQCIVTGGLGTIAVSHNGSTYYVCCEGCRQAFDADPEGTIADYRERIRQQSENR